MLHTHEIYKRMEKPMEKNDPSTESRVQYLQKEFRRTMVSDKLQVTTGERESKKQSA